MKKNLKLIIMSLILAMGLFVVGCDTNNDKTNYEFESFVDYQDTIESIANKKIAKEFDINLDNDEIELYLKAMGQEKDSEAAQNLIKIVGEEKYYDSMESNYLFANLQQLVQEKAQNYSEEEISAGLEDNKELFEAMELTEKEEQENFVRMIEANKELEKTRLDAYSEATIEVLENVNPDYLNSLDLKDDPKALDEYINNHVLGSLFN